MDQKSLKSSGDPRRSDAPGGVSRLALALAVGFIGLFCAGGVVGSLVLGTRSTDEPVRVTEILGASSTETTESNVSPDSGSDDDPESIELKLELAGEAADSVAIDVRHSQLDLYRESSLYGLKGTVKNVSDRELVQIVAVVELMNADGTVLHRDAPGLLWDHQPELRPGDIAPINLIQRASGEVQRVRLTVEQAQGPRASNDYPEARPIDVKLGKLGTKISERLTVDVRERRVMHEPRDDGRNDFRATFEVENTGQDAIEELKLQLELYSRSGELLDTKAGIVTYPMLPAIRPGETWLEEFTARVPNDYHRYDLTVTELR